MSKADEVLAQGAYFASFRDVGPHKGIHVGEFTEWSIRHGEALLRIAQAARESLKDGAHDGWCTNVSDPHHSCELHTAAADRHRADLQAALDALGESKPAP